MSESTRVASGTAPFPGQYALISSTRVETDGREVGHHWPATGRVWYGVDGRMWVLLTPDTRKPLGARDAAMADDFRDLLDGVVSYCGSYRVDEAAGTVVHHVDISIFPEWVGREMVRQFEFSGNRLTLRIHTDEYRVATVYERLSEPERS